MDNPEPAPHTPTIIIRAQISILLIITLSSAFFLTSCRDGSRKSPGGGTNRTGAAPVYSEWHDVLDTSLMVDKLSGSTLSWSRLEGRNHNGLSQFRWVTKQWPMKERFRYAIVYNNTVEKYYEEGRKWHGKGYDRVSLNVFIDGSGIARYQAIWISPPENKDSLIKPSALSDDGREIRRERFTPWESRRESNRRFDERKPAESVLYLETRENDETRVIYTDSPRLNFFTRWWCGELLFLRHCKEYALQGYRLLSVSVSERPDFTRIYSGVWVASDDYPKAREALLQLGISPAEEMTPEEIEAALIRSTGWDRAAE